MSLLWAFDTFVRGDNRAINEEKKEEFYLFETLFENVFFYSNRLHQKVKLFEVLMSLEDVSHLVLSTFCRFFHGFAYSPID